jgi:hypothetical protein
MEDARGAYTRKCTAQKQCHRSKQRRGLLRAFAFCDDSQNGPPQSLFFNIHAPFKPPSHFFSNLFLATLRWSSGSSMK